MYYPSTVLSGDVQLTTVTPTSETPIAELSKATIVVVDDDRIAARDLQQQLQALGFDVADLVTTSDDALGIVARLRPDLVLVDAGLGGDLDGVTLADRIRRGNNPPQVVMVSGRGNAESIAQACDAGASGYLVKPFDASQLLATVLVGLARGRQERSDHEERRRTAMALHTLAADLVKRQDTEAAQSRAHLMAQLSAREQRIVQLLAEHYRPRSVAVELNISYHTVRNHLRRIFRKLNVSSQSELLRALAEH